MGVRRVPGYEVLETLQDHGPAVTYLARQTATERTVVLETVLPGAFSSRGKADRWIIQARELRKLSHPGLVRVLDTGRTGPIWVAREWVPGVTLRSLLESGWEFNPVQALSVAAAVAEALAYLHRCQRAHGALCPGAVLLAAEGETRLDGLGGLVVSGPTDPSFLAPEINAGGAPSRAGDLYSLGRLLERLFPEPVGQALPALVHALTASDPAARPTSTRGVAETLRFLLARALPPPEPAPDLDEVLNLADAVTDLGLPLTAFRTRESAPRPERTESPEKRFSWTPFWAAGSGRGFRGSRPG